MKNEESRGHSTPFSMIALISNRLRSSTKTNNKNRLIDLNKNKIQLPFVSKEHNSLVKASKVEVMETSIPSKKKLWKKLSSLFCYLIKLPFNPN